MKKVPQRTMRLAALPLLGLLAGCNDLVVMHPAGDVAVQQRDLLVISTLLMLLIIVPVIILTVLFAWRYRESNKAATYDPEFDHSTMLELVIWSAPLLIIICLGALTWGSTHLLDPYRPIGRVAPGQNVASGAKPVEVDVVALDWKWLFIYPQFGVATVNELTLPVNVPVHFRITASSIMNSFYVPALAGQIYAMPGMETALNAVLNKPGNYNGFSANYSGAGFSDMNFAVHGVDQAGFQRWIGAVRSGGPTISRATYMQLEKPSEREPVRHFAGTEPGLFNRVVNECVEPNRPCMADVMMRDSQSRNGTAAHGVNDTAAPAHGQHPTGALLKSSGEKGASPNMTVPRTPGTPGNLAPGSKKNRDLSLNDAARASRPLAAPVGRA